MASNTPIIAGNTVVVPVAIPLYVYATLQGIANAGAGVSVDWLLSFAVRDFARTYAERLEDCEAPPSKEDRR